MEEKNTVKFKSRQFAIDIIMLYKWICENKRNMFCPSRFFVVELALERTSPRQNQVSQKKTFSPKCILRSKKVARLYFGSTLCMQLIILMTQTSMN